MLGINIITILPTFTRATHTPRTLITRTRRIRTTAPTLITDTGMATVMAIGRIRITTAIRGIRIVAGKRSTAMYKIRYAVAFAGLLTWLAGCVVSVGFGFGYPYGYYHSYAY